MIRSRLKSARTAWLRACLVAFAWGLFAIPTLSHAQVFQPHGGLWWNPAAAGHGFDITPVGGNIVVVWYTYDEAGNPTWYLATGLPDGTSLAVPMYRYRWDADTQSPIESRAGTLSIDFSDQDSANLQWELDGKVGSEPIVRYVFDDTARVVEDITGLWYQPDRPGYGFTVVHQGATLVSVLYFYDANGDPRWVLGNDGYGGGPATLIARAFTGPCPYCDRAAGIAPVSGFFTTNISQRHSGTFVAAVMLKAPLAGAWLVDFEPVENLSTAPSVGAAQPPNGGSL
ncbi:MAG: hypothetical protein KDH20_19705 [Rhodocyclaceae bacterium]|nr:hypothetical protein [Rhodocyclaceae bacterium]